MTTTHTTRDGRPVTIDRIGKRWMRGWIVNLTDRNIRWRDKWHKTGIHPFEADMDLTPVAAPVTIRPQTFTITIPRDAEIRDLQWFLARMCDAYEAVCSDTGKDYHKSATSYYAEARAFLARNGGAK